IIVCHHKVSTYFGGHLMHQSTQKQKVQGNSRLPLVETCKINDVDPLAYLTDVLTRIVNGHPNRDIDLLLPWAYRAQALKAVA
ncbi:MULTISPECIES: transposase domain-containing protein, partial [unclassified Bradyrhizobium]|uniref:transposase domain-containing protein n=1 Tax=unclassified Bradyrhizobium TaxID=2631580 RepID=UPI001FF81FBE